MNLEQLCGLVESLLFVSDGPIELPRLQSILEVGETELEIAVKTLAEDTQRRGLRVQRQGKAIQLVTAPEAAPYVERLLGVQATSRLSSAAMETLAIVAYRQPITRAGIEAIRGVNVERSLSTLQSRGLIAESGRLDAVGRPILYCTTFEFLEHFGLQSLAELPSMEEFTQGGTVGA